MARRVFGQVYQRPFREGWYVKYPTGDRTASGRTSYRVRRVDSKAHGDAVLRAVRHDYLRGKRPPPKEAGAALTLAEVVARHIDAVERAPGTVASYQRTLALLGTTGKMRAIEVRPRHLERWAKGLDLGPATSRRHLSVVLAALARAHRDELLPTHPAKRTRLPRVPRKDKAIFRADEIRRLRAVCEGEIGVFVVLGLYTGARTGEILGMTWGDVDLAARLVTIRRPKVGNVGTVRLHAEAVAVLEAHRAAGGRIPQSVDRIITIANPWHVLRVRLTRAGITREGLSPHSLRHTFASHYIASGGSIRRLQAILGHGGLATTERYVRDLPDLTDGEIDGLDFGEHTRSTPAASDSA